MNDATRRCYSPVAPTPTMGMAAGNSVRITSDARPSLTLPGPDRAHVGERTTPPNMELKLTKPSIMELRSLTPVLGGLDGLDGQSRRLEAVC